MNNQDESFSIVKKNFFEDAKNAFTYNFIDSKRGLYTLLLIAGFRFYQQIPFMKIIKSNKEIFLNFVKQNALLKVKPVYKSSELDTSSNLELNFKHIPLLDKSFINFKNSPLSNLQIKLAGIESLSQEGQDFLQKLLNPENADQFKFYLKLNNKNNEEEVFSWVLFKYKNRIPFISFLSRRINLNVLLAEKGYAKICDINTDNIYDENIYYFMSDLLEAEKSAKIEAVGIWKNRRSGIAKEYKHNSDHKSGILGKMKKNLHIMKMPKWQKILLRRNIM